MNSSQEEYIERLEQELRTERLTSFANAEAAEEWERRAIVAEACLVAIQTLLYERLPLPSSEGKRCI